jgi:acetylornithine deacetylase/succinyl-diaminopimelate desuccinylase-like protein
MTETLALDDALRYAADHRDETLADLVELSKIPSVSALPAHAGDVRAAEWCAERLRAVLYLADQFVNKLVNCGGR